MQGELPLGLPLWLTLRRGLLRFHHRVCRTALAELAVQKSGAANLPLLHRAGNCLQPVSGRQAM